jgi:hypothetical protein
MIESSLKDAFDSVEVCDATQPQLPMANTKLTQRSSAIELPPHGQRYLPYAHATH